MSKNQNKSFCKWDGGYYSVIEFDPKLVIVRVLSGVVRIDYAGAQISHLEAELAAEGYILEERYDPMKQEVERKLDLIKLKNERAIEKAIQKIKAINDYHV